jgi:ribosome modulation factor
MGLTINATAWQQGFDAGKASTGPCPYTPTSNEAFSWSSGWIEGNAEGWIDTNPDTPEKYLIEARNKNPNTSHPERLTRYYAYAPTRDEAAYCAKIYLSRGQWVEIYDTKTGELLAGPFSPDHPAPKFIL